MSQIGDMLREARIRRGLSIKDVSDITKIRGRYLEALEQDDYEVMPGSTFVKAYLRNYATFLKLDADGLVDEYRYAHEPRSSELGPYHNNTAEQPRAPGPTTRKRPRGRHDRRGYALIAILAIVVVVLLAWFGTGRGKSGATLEPESVGGAVVSTSTTGGGTTVVDGTTTTGEDGEGESTTTSSLASVPTGEDVKLVVTVAEGSCFLVVREDNEEGAELYAGTLSAGEEETFDGSKRYWLHVGAPDVIVVSVNGVERSLAGPAGFYVITETQIEPAE